MLQPIKFCETSSLFITFKIITLQLNTIFFRDIDVRWTWTCTNQHCERIAASKGVRPTSLTTCNTLCGTPHLWPLPTGPFTIGHKIVHFSQHQISFESSVGDPARTLLSHALAIFNDSIADVTQPFDANQKGSEVESFLVRIFISNTNEVKLSIKTNESYNLTVIHKGGVITVDVTAVTFFGARHGLETLSQLIWRDDYDDLLSIITDVNIRDVPSFSYRGLMLDTSRNFISINGIKHAVDGMAANKLNVLHWHVSDSQSFPLELPSVPQLHIHGAYGSSQVYKATDVKNLVEYARVRGIRVVIEIDVPAHAGNGWTWGPDEGLGELAVCINAQPWSLFCGEPPCGQLNPENPNVYDILEKIYHDILQLTDETEIFHIGGDEVNLDCWEQYLNKNVTSGNFTDLHFLWGDFTLKALKRLEKANGGRRPPYTIVWSSNLSKRPYNLMYLDKNTVVQSWGASDWTETRDLISDGYKIILSHVNAWYLDCGFGRWRERGEAACDPYKPWQTMYSHRPWGYESEYKRSTIGLEACLWSEQLDEISLDTRLWPRTSAFAERAWSDPNTDSDSYMVSESVYTRLAAQRERMLKRGFGVEALWPQWCTQNPGMCL